jgi:hypothetical protein
MLKAVLRERGWWVAASKTADHTLTHVFLDGGSASVCTSAEAQAALAAAYVHDAARNVPLHVVERTIRGGSYRMFADFDVALLADTGFPELHPVRDIKRIVEYAIDHLPPELRRGSIVVCLRESHASARLPTKLGAHLIWSDELRVDDAIAARLRDAWVARCEAASGGDGRWEATIDRAVYRSNGLRMPWSRKGNGKGGADRSVYVPSIEIEYGASQVKVTSFGGGAGAAAQAAACPVLLQRCSIRATAAPPPPSSSPSPSSSSSPSPPLHRAVPVAVSLVDVAAVAHVALVDVAAVAAVVAQRWGSHVASSLRQVTPLDNQSSCVVFSCNSSLCVVAGRRHNSNRIYFCAVRRGHTWSLRQLCHSAHCADTYADLGVLRPVRAADLRRTLYAGRTVADASADWLARIL